MCVIKFYVCVIFFAHPRLKSMHETQNNVCMYISIYNHCFIPIINRVFEGDILRPLQCNGFVSFIITNGFVKGARLGILYRKITTKIWQNNNYVYDIQVGSIYTVMSMTQGKVYRSIRKQKKMKNQGDFPMVAEATQMAHVPIYIILYLHKQVLRVFY